MVGWVQQGGSIVKCENHNWVIITIVKPSGKNSMFRVRCTKCGEITLQPLSWCPPKLEVVK